MTGRRRGATQQGYKSDDRNCRCCCGVSGVSPAVCCGSVVVTMCSECLSHALNKSTERFVASVGCIVSSQPAASLRLSRPSSGAWSVICCCWSAVCVAGWLTCKSVRQAGAVLLEEVAVDGADVRQLQAAGPA